jgi:hypothetical protein
MFDLDKTIPENFEILQNTIINGEDAQRPIIFRLWSSYLQAHKQGKLYGDAKPEQMKVDFEFESERREVC